MDANILPEDDDAVCTEQLKSESVIDTIVRLVANQKNTSPTGLDTMYDNIDSNALVELLDHAEEHGSNVNVEFEFEGYRVVASQDGLVCIR